MMEIKGRNEKILMHIEGGDKHGIRQVFCERYHPGL